MAQHILITGDDCGLSEGINRATADLHERGLLHSASIMTNFAATPHAFESLGHYEQLELGVHLNLSDGYPIIPLGGNTPLTAADGRFHDRPTMWWRALWPPKGYLELVEDELRAQILRFVDYGRRPVHLTTHLQFHIVPTLREIVLRLAREFDVPYVRAYSLRAAIAPHHRLLRRLSRARGFSQATCSDYIIGIKWWLGRNPGELVSALYRLRGSIEIIVHPSLPQDDSFPERVRYRPHERYLEMDYLETVYRLWQSLRH